jgi:hypothetical protein
MDFFFPDSQDQISPFFDFLSEEHPLHRIRQRDDRYAHEVLKTIPYNGILISKVIIDGMKGRTGQYSESQKERIYRVGAHRFFRTEVPSGPSKIMGDCGAFAYVDSDVPPYTIDEVISFYEGIGLDFGISMDHIVLDYLSDHRKKTVTEVDPEWVRRRELTIEIATEFFAEVKKQKCGFTPIGVAHGWDPESYKLSVEELEKIGFKRIALGGMVPLRTGDILNVLSSISETRRPKTQLHLLGVTRPKFMPQFASLGVTSFDSTSPFRQAFMDDKHNYYVKDDSYVALRVPQPDGNTMLRRRIQAGELDQKVVREAEQHCLRCLRAFDAGETTIEDALDALRSYEIIYDTKNRDRSESYERTLEASPWKSCKCGVCDAVGIEVIIFRGAERNKRRGFHNLSIFRKRLDSSLSAND